MSLVRTVRVVFPLVLAACAPYGAEVGDRNSGRIDVRPAGYSVAAVEAPTGERWKTKAVGRYAGKDWTIVSHDHASGRYVESREERRSVRLDFDGDGRPDATVFVPSVDFELRNGVNRASIVAQTVYLDALEEKLDLRAWMHDVVEGHSGAVYWRRFEKRFTSRIATEGRRSIAGLEAYEATDEVTDVDRLHYVANNVDRVVSLVAVRLPQPICLEGNCYRCVPALVALWCESERADAASCRQDLDTLIGSVSWPKKV